MSVQAMGGPRVIDVGGGPESAALRDTLAAHLDAEPTANGVYEVLGGSGLRGVMAEVAPDTLAALRTGEADLADAGFFVVSGTGVDTAPTELGQLISITLGSAFGNPTRTDKRKNQIAWPVKYAGPSTEHRTISLTRERGGFHTDTQYYPDPEPTFALFCVESDVPGQGTNQLIHASDVVAALQGEDPAVLAALRQPYPFRIPTEYTTAGNDPDLVEITRAPIVDEAGHIRYRQDTLARGIAATGDETSAEQRKALAVLERVLGEVAVTEYHLLPGQAGFFNNETVLHDRTGFTNPDRLMYRVRMARPKRSLS